MFQKPGVSENGRLSVCTVDRKASIVSSIYQDVSPTKKEVSPAPSQHSFVEEVPKISRAESMRTAGGTVLPVICTYVTDWSLLLLIPKETQIVARRGKQLGPK